MERRSESSHAFFRIVTPDCDGPMKLFSSKVAKTFPRTLWAFIQKGCFLRFILELCQVHGYSLCALFGHSFEGKIDLKF